MKKMKQDRLLLAMVLGVLLMGFAPQAQGGGRLVSLEECARTADHIFVGTLTDIKTRWAADGKLIWTDYIFTMQDSWKGKQGKRLHTVSVGGGTVGSTTIRLTEVPTFEMGATYVIYAHDNAKRYAEAVVGIDQGMFREVEDADTGERILIDARGYRMEEVKDNTIVKGRLTRKVNNSEKAHVMNDEELIQQQELFEAKYGSLPVDPPVVRDAEGNILASEPAPVETAREKAASKVMAMPQGTPLTRERLKAFTAKALAKPHAGKATTPSTGGGR